MLTINSLKRYVPFNGLDDRYLEEALSHIAEREFEKGQMLFKRGRAVAEKYFLLEGQVDLINNAFAVSTVNSDSPFADSALNLESPTVNSAVAKSNMVKAFAIDAEVLDRITAWSQSAASASIDGDSSGVDFSVEELHDEIANDWMSSLLQSPLFSRIPLTQVQELFLRFEDIELEKDEVIVREGEPGDYFYVVASGKVRVTNRSESVDVTLEPGKYFGEEALLGDTLRNATVTMFEGGRIKRLNREDFMALLKAPVIRYIEDRLLSKLGKPYKLLDVKMPIEYRANHLPGSINVPLSRLRDSMADLGRSNVYVVPDDAGSRADIAAHLLCQAGFEAVVLKREAAPTGVESAVAAATN